VELATTVAGAALVAISASLARDRRWRLPALAFLTLALPGSLDNVLPQFALDPHPIPHATAPAFSFVDLVLLWATLLTILEVRTEGSGPPASGDRLLAAAALVAIAASFASVAAFIAGVELGAVVRGALVFWRIAAVLWLARALKPGPDEASLTALAVAAGAVVLFGNAAYTTLTSGAERLTASTFGRNGLGLTLVLTGLVVGAGAIDARRFGPRWRRAVPRALLGLVATGCLAAALATGTRMATLLLVLGVAMAAGAWWRGRRPGRRIVVLIGAAIVVGGIFVQTIPSAQRSVALLLDPATAVDLILRPQSVPEGQPIVTRAAFWELAAEMTAANPLTGVGPFQWNHRRYDLDPETPVAVADVHNGYLQVAAEYGLVVGLGYLLLVGGCLWRLARVYGRFMREPRAPLVVGFVIAGLLYPVGDLTNSHLFNIRNGLLGWLLIAFALALVARPAAGPPEQSTDELDRVVV
jgi:O-antigen ligase